MQNPYEIIKSRYITEKTTVLEGLHTKENNRSLRACKNPHYVFIVEKNANKQQIKCALEKIYCAQSIKVVAVNTIQMKAKATRAKRGRAGAKPAFKKAIVTLAVGDKIDSV
ncbi:MAG: 50S ribosomal protein L23 [Chlamydiae bacterium]|nr:50S ribosomal protein L23 [Chlamydiota bacterium]